MTHHAHVIATDGIMRAAEGFHDCGIPDATRSPKTQTVENHIHTIGVAGIDDRSF
jgi:hypothetical protein